MYYNVGFHNLLMCFGMIIIVWLQLQSGAGMSPKILKQISLLSILVPSSRNQSFVDVFLVKCMKEGLGLRQA